MSETNNQTEDQEKDLSPEEYHKLRVAAQKELREEIKFLKTELEYQDIMAKIEEAKARRLKAVAIQYQLQNPNPEMNYPPGQPPKDYDHPVAAPQPFADKEPEQPEAGRKMVKPRTLKED